MSSEEDSEPTGRSSPPTPPKSSSKPMVTERLTPAEIESLRRDAKEAGEYLKKAFGRKSEDAGKE